MLSNGGDVRPPLSMYFTSSPINRIENALRDLEELFPVEPCTVLKLNKTASPKLISGIKMFFSNLFHFQLLYRYYFVCQARLLGDS